MPGFEDEHLKLFASPRKAMPVGMFKPAANTEAVNPAGRLIDGVRLGLKNAVLFMQSGAVEGLLTVCALATLGSAASNAIAAIVHRGCGKFDLIANTSSLVDK
jgi:hypothetical protein